MAPSDVSELKVGVLPAGFIIKDVIGDFEHKPLYNYEDWLRELANESAAFMAKTEERSLSLQTRRRTENPMR